MKDGWIKMIFFSKNKALIMIISLALLFRVAYVLFYPQQDVVRDAKQYDMLAAGLIEQGVFLDWKLEQRIIRPPGYPLFLAGIYSLFGHSYLAVRLWHCLFGTLTAVFIYLISIRLFKKKIIPLLATALIGFHPPLIGWTGILYTETIFTFFLVVSVYFFQRSVLDKNFFHSFFSGFFLALAALSSSRIIYYPFFLLVVCWFFSEKRKLVLKQWLVMLITMLLTISPWTIRNYKITGKFIPLETAHKAGLWFATNPYDVHQWEGEHIRRLLDGRTPAEQEKIMYEEAIENLKRYPFAYLKNNFKRFYRLWCSGHSYIFSGLEKRLVDAWQTKDFRLFSIKFFFLNINLLLVVSGFIGILLIKKRFKKFLVVLSPITYLTLLHTCVYGGPRLSVPILPILLIFSAISIEKFLSEINFFGNRNVKKI